MVHMELQPRAAAKSQRTSALLGAALFAVGTVALFGRTAFDATKFSMSVNLAQTQKGAMEDMFDRVHDDPMRFGPVVMAESNKEVAESLDVENVKKTSLSGMSKEQMQANELSGELQATVDMLDESMAATASAEKEEAASADVTADVRSKEIGKARKDEAFSSDEAFGSDRVAELYAMDVPHKHKKSLPLTSKMTSKQAQSVVESQMSELGVSQAKSEKSSRQSQAIAASQLSELEQVVTQFSTEKQLADKWARRPNPFRRAAKPMANPFRREKKTTAGRARLVVQTETSKRTASNVLDAGAMKISQGNDTRIQQLINSRLHNSDPDVLSLRLSSSQKSFAEGPFVDAAVRQRLFLQF